MKKLLFFLMPFYVFAQHNIIPEPLRYREMAGQFFLDSNTGILSESPDMITATAISDLKGFLKKKQINLQEKQAKKLITVITNNVGPAEGYELNIESNKIIVTGNSPAGVHNAIQTLKQIISSFHVDGHNVVAIKNCVVEDSPKYTWRGLMLDESRHFFGVEDVKKFIDQMALYKFNILHWHLTDDEGWRIEIKAFPKLTEVGAWRVERNGKFGEGRPFPKSGEKATVGGFYTQEQIKDVIKYAAARNIQILPEIEFPGHSMATLAAYPNLSTKKEPKFVNPGSKFSEWYPDGTFKMLIENTLNPADEAVYDFAEKVLTEVAALFPFEYIHMGGDECYHGYWEKDKAVQAFMKKNQLRTTHELQTYFVNRINKIVSSKGKKLIGWDEILEGNLDKSAAVMSWRGVKGGIEAAKKGHSVVMSPTTHAYLDYTQGDATLENPIYASLSLKKTYSFDPVAEGVDPNFILGSQGNVWTEMITTMPFCMYMTYPRALALIEGAWSQTKDYGKFLKKLDHHFDWFEMDNMPISKAIYDPELTVKNEGGKIMVTLSNDIQGAEIFYSMDNTYPVKYSTRYTGPFEKKNGDYRLRAQVYKNGKALGREIILPAAEIEKRIKK